MTKFHNITALLLFCEEMPRRASMISHDGSQGMGENTRTPCDASISMPPEYDAIAHLDVERVEQVSSKAGHCCQKNSDSSINSSKHDEKLDEDSGISNSRDTLPIIGHNGERTKAENQLNEKFHTQF